MIIQSPYSDLQVLIVDDLQTQRTTLRGQLQMLHINKVDQASTAEDAARLCKTKKYDLVLCDYNLNQKTDGQQLLEFLRDNKLLSSVCMFFMVTAENSYMSVASVGEHKPDAYLLKPITAGEVEERLKILMERNQALSTLNDLMQRDKLQDALAECNALLEKKNRWSMHVLNLKGQILLQLGQYEEAKDVYNQALAVRSSLSWAQLGLAKALKATGNIDDARFIAQNILDSKEGEKFVEAYDIVASCMEEQGDIEGALIVLKNSAQIMPSARRQRIVAEVAYLNGDLDTANECYDRLAKLTRGSITGLPQDVLAQSQTLVDSGKTAEAMKLLDSGQTQFKMDQQFLTTSFAVRAQAQMKAGDKEGAEASLTKAKQGMRRAKADFATIALAKAELSAGQEEEAIKLMQTVISADHENARVKQLIGNALKTSGHEDKVSTIVEGAVGEINKRIAKAKTLFRESKLDEALAEIEEAIKQYPENTGVLLQAAQMNCMSLRLKNQFNAVTADRVRIYLNKLDNLMPNSDRVNQMRLYYRDTINALQNAKK